jgi:fructose-bisphosphate aldolase class II
MTAVGTGEIVAAAQAAGTGAAAFNVITLEHAEAVVTAAERIGLPVIVQVSENALAFHGDDPAPLGRAVIALADASRCPVALHLDHSTSLELCMRAADAGYSSVMFDASALPAENNVAETRRASEWAHSRGVWIEAELGVIGGKDGAHAPGVRTRPDEARDFVASTGVDALAVAVGSSHAMSDRTAALDLDLIGLIRDAVAAPLVLHGSSGVPDRDIRRAIEHGMVKINVGTALNVAFTTTLDASLRSRGGSSDPRPHLAAARSSVADTVDSLLRVIAGREPVLG